MSLKKYGFAYIFVIELILCGCASSPTDTNWPEPRPLGEKLPAYRASQDTETDGIKISILEPSEVLTLYQALALALMHNPDLAVFSLEVRAGEARVLQAGLLPNPELECELEDFAGKGERRDFEALQTTISLRQLIPLGGKISKQTKVASLERDLAAWDYEGKRLEVLTKVSVAFTEVLSAQEQLKSSEELLGLARQILQTVSARVKAGKDYAVEEVKARITVSNIEIAWEQAKCNLEAARKRLAILWGSSSPSFKEAQGTFYAVSDVPPFDQLLNQISQNPDIARWQTELEKGRATIELEDAKAYPDITVGAGIRIFNESDDHAFLGTISIPLPIFDRNQGGSQEARYRLAQAEKKKQAAELMIYSKLNEAYQTLSSSFSEVKTLKEKILPDVESTVKTLTESYREGKSNYMEVLDAQRTLFQVKRQYIDALTLYHKTVIEMEGLVANKLTSLESKKSEKGAR